MGTLSDTAQARANSQALTWRLLAGLQAGIVAACIMAVCLVFENLRRGQPAWHWPNLLASTLLSPAALDLQFGTATLVGYAFLLLLCGTQGMLFGLLVPPRLATRWTANAGIVYSLAWYVVVYRGVLGAWNPLLANRGPRGAMILGYFLFGATLGFYGRYYRALSRPLAEPPLAAPVLPEQSPQAGAATPPTGEAPPFNA